METESGYVGIGNASLYYELGGEGRPMVLIHAGVADSRQWNHEFSHFAHEFRVLRYDLRGHGKSRPVEGEFSHMGDLIALLEQLGLREPLALIGCSMGGGLAMDFALAHPSKVSALVMVGSGPSGLRLDVPDHPKEAEAEEAWNAGQLDLVAELEAQIWFDGMGRTAQQVNPQMRNLALEMSRLVLSHDSKRLGRRLPDSITPAVDRLGELAMPVLVIVGEHDIPYIKTAADYMVDKIPSVRKVTLEDAAHLPNMDHPDQFHWT
ncbi:MAG: alpha/beta fold hydrolase, partial [Anaerolineales bacterium]